MWGISEVFVTDDPSGKYEVQGFARVNTNGTNNEMKNVVT